jgi:hypothetical protein
MSRRKIADVMTRDVISVAEDTPFREIVDVRDDLDQVSGIDVGQVWVEADDGVVTLSGQEPAGGLACSR